jgi:hypothetical protein
MINKIRTSQVLALAFGLVLTLAPAALAQGDSMGQTSANTRTVASGQKMKIRGVVTHRDADTFTVRENQRRIPPQR